MNGLVMCDVKVWGRIKECLKSCVSDSVWWRHRPGDPDWAMALNSILAEMEREEGLQYSYGVPMTAEKEFLSEQVEKCIHGCVDAMAKAQEEALKRWMEHDRERCRKAGAFYDRIEERKGTGSECRWWTFSKEMGVHECRRRCAYQLRHGGDWCGDWEAKLG